MMMLDLISKLRKLDIDIRLEDDRLKINAPEGTLTPVLIDELKNKKPEIIEFLQQNVNGHVKYVPLEPVEEKEYYKLSSAQSRLYFLQQLGLQITVYNMSQVIELNEPVEAKRIEETFRKLIKRHEALRTSFLIEENNPVQKVHDEVAFEIEYHDLVSQTPAVQEVIDTFVRAFDLDQPPLLRVGLVKIEEVKYLLVVDIHHIIADGFSNQVLVKDFIALYHGRQLPLIKLQYKDYVEWQNSQLQGETLGKQRDYWLNVFSGEIPLLQLPMDYPRPSPQSFEGDNFFFEIPQSETAALKEISRKSGMTLYGILLAIFYILMSKLSEQEDIVFGTPVAGRAHADLTGIIGVFVNTLVLRNYPAGEKTFEFFLHEVNQHALQAFENQGFPFDELVNRVVKNRDTSRNPLFDVMFAFLGGEENQDNIPVENTPPQADGTEEIYRYKNQVSRFDMSWYGMEMGNTVSFTVEYSTRLFKEETIRGFAHYFKRAASVVIDDTGKKISEIEIISEEEKKQVLVDFNRTGVDYPRDKTIHRLFREQAQQTPHHIAVVDEGTRPDPISITYNQLNQQADDLANVLQGKGINSEDIVGIMVGRSITMTAAMLAILKAGGAYLPLDPKLPEERISYMLKDSKTKILVISHTLAQKDEKVKRLEVEKILLDEVTGGDLSLPPHPLRQPTPVTSLAYVIYTSGSTGKPKGVMVMHGNVVRLVKPANYIDWEENDRLLLTGALAFDITTFEVWGPLLNGLSLYLTGENVIMDAEKLWETLKKNQITILHLIPQLLGQLVSQSEGFNLFAELKYLLTGGDKVKTMTVNGIRLDRKELKVLHMYGPTENTTFSTFLQVEKYYDITIPIGKPIDHSTAYIMDKYGKLQPLAAVGELVVGGDGVARGYLNNPELTAEKFRPAFNRTYRSHRSSRSYIYKTGDLAKWLPDGNIEFLGRIDHQVKLRGQRIELREIEYHLLKHEDIEEAVVLPQKTGDNQFLCAYIVSRKELKKPGLREYLSIQLPEYMVPSHFIQVAEMPLTSNGKLDKQALPDPEIAAPGQYKAPRNRIEEGLCKILAKILVIEKEKISITENLFEMGGDSMSLLRFSSKIYEEFKVEIPMTQIYNIPTIEAIADCVITKDYIEESLVIRNKKQSKKIFCFPPQIGFGFVYDALVPFLADYSICSFHFIEEEDRLKKYADIITNLQPEGPYIFFGMSAAGPLSFSVARELENQGYEVSDIIFFDCYFLGEILAKETLSEEYVKFMNTYIENSLKDAGAIFFKNKIIRKMDKHMEYFHKTTTLEVINANVHLIASESPRDDDMFRSWDNLTNKGSFVYHGAGKHIEMLQPGPLEKNMAVMKNILAEIEKKRNNKIN